MLSDPIFNQLLIGVLATLIYDKAKRLNKGKWQKPFISGRIEFSLSVCELIVTLIIIALLIRTNA
jgi:hypothetical protein